MPSCGKSVTGVVLAKILNKKYIDADLLIQEKAGKGLQDIINNEGIDAFKKLEEEVLKFWQENGSFAKSLKQRENCEEYVFYDGPPFATGMPHYGHLLAGTIKDVIPRYQTMRGKFVKRTFGWDCHGLPVENEMEKIGVEYKFFHK